MGKVFDIVKVWEGDNLIEQNIEFLRRPTKSVDFPINDHIESIINNLIECYQSLPCAGIAANQLGYNKKIFIGMKHDREISVSESSQNIDDVLPDPENYEIYINPQIDKIDEKSIQTGNEGCLSIPFLTLDLIRYNKIKVRYYDKIGKKIKKPLSGFLSRLFQHELDHLNGKLMLEHKNINNTSMLPEDDKYKKLAIKLINYLQN